MTAENEAEMRDLILQTAEDLGGSFLYYDRKEDEELPVGAIEDAISRGVVTVDEILGIFREQIEASVKREAR